MNELKIEAIFRGISLLSKTLQKWHMERAGRQPFGSGQLAFFIDTTREMAAALDKAELPISRKHAEELVGAFGQATAQKEGSVVLEGMPLQLAYHHMSRLLAVIAEEGGTRLFVSVSVANLYAPTKPPFGDDVAQKFPSIAYDVDEAGRCFALQRSTAAAFHAIRCLEAGIRALSRCLQIPDPTKAHERSWHNLLNCLKNCGHSSFVGHY